MTKHHPWVAKGAFSLLAAGFASFAIAAGLPARPAPHATGPQVPAASQTKTVIMGEPRPADPVEVEALLENGKYVARAKPSQDDLKWFIIPGKVMRAPLG